MQTIPRGPGRTAATTLTLLIAVATLGGCGTTSQLEAPTEIGVIDLTPYSRLIVEDFRDEATARAKPEERPIVEPRIKAATTAFPDMIAAVVREGGGFDEVVRGGTPDASTLVLRGAIGKFDPGNATLQILVGFGAGTANLDARLDLVDGGSGKVLGTWIVNKNSWALGGFIAASQKPEDFMQEAARKIGTELSDKRKTGSIKRPTN